MWRRSLYLFSTLLILASIGAVFIQSPLVYADSQQEEASSDCKPAVAIGTAVGNLSSDQQIAACEKGFLAALQKDAPKPPISSEAKQKCQQQGSTAATSVTIDICQVYLTKQGLCYSSLYKSDSNSAYYCQIGYNIAYYRLSGLANLPAQPTQQQQQNQQQQNQAQQACQPNIPGAGNSNQLMQDCVTGYIGALNGQPQTQACPSSVGGGAAIDQQYCVTGFGLQQAAAGDAANKQLGCEGQFSSPLTWIVCPVVNDILVPVINFIDNMITDQLNVKTSAIFCDTGDTCKAYYAAWQSFRNIALGLMTIAGLAIVIAQALGMEILDAYTIRKTLPRLLIAAVAITLSWPLMRFLINLSDDLGFGVRHLIYAPFSGLSDTLDLSFGGGIANIFGSAGVGVGAVAGWLVLGGFGALIAYAGTAALAVFVAILVLILRQVAIILLMLLAPIAIIMYILPNTQRVYRLWWESFSKALLMFPLIAAFIATGRVFSAIAIHNGSFINQLIGFTAYFAPYFMIPLTFKMAGATMSGLGNFVQSRAQGGFSMLSGFRGQQRKQRLERVRARGLYRGTNRLTKGLNKLGHYTWNADEQLPMDIGTGRGVGRLTGKAGKRLFGRMAGELAGKKAGMFAEQTAKGVEQTNNHYSTDWALLGLRHRFAGDREMSAKNRQAMDDKYGLKQNDEGQWVKTQAGEEANLWRAPENGDYHGLLEYGSDLRKYGEAGSMAQYAGVQLDEARVGTLSSFGKHMETQRATVQSVALTSAAKDGKLNHEEAILALDPMRQSADPVVKAFAQAQQAQMERVAQGPRQDWRPGKGMRFNEEGNPYNVHGDTPVRELQGDGSSYAMVPAYKTKEAYADSSSMKGSAAMGAKAESIKNQKPTILSMINEERPELLKPGEAQAMKDAAIAGSMNSYGDPDSILEWKDILSKLPQPTPEETARAHKLVDEQNRRATAAGGPPKPPGLSPPSLPGGGIPQPPSII